MKACWIWKRDTAHPPSPAYNQAVAAFRRFKEKRFSRAVLKITADSWYRLFINGAWVTDGPCRSWNQHFQYDEIDVTAYLKAGWNELRVLARYWGTGTFHTIPQQAGLLAELHIERPAGRHIVIASDERWLVSDFPALAWNTPKASIQMEPQEYYDARLEEALDFTPAVVLHRAGEGPWQDLHRRDVPLLTRQPLAFRRFHGAQVVAPRRERHYCLPAAHLNYPHLIEANRAVALPGGVCAQLQLDQPMTLQFAEEGVTLYLDGVHQPDGRYELAAGSHLLLALISEILGHNKEKSFRLLSPLLEGTDMGLQGGGMRMVTPWYWLDFPEYRYVGDDLRWLEHGLPPELAARVDGYAQLSAFLGALTASPADFLDLTASRLMPLPEAQLFARDTHWRFVHRQPLPGVSPRVENPAALMYDNPELTVIHPAPEGDIELCYDLGCQSIGYLDFELTAPAGVEIDFYLVEYITPQGVIQHTLGNRNGMTYLTRQGVNRFTSTKRRSGRYLFITLRNLRQPVSIRKLQLIESTYPVNPIGGFACSDPRLDQIFEISARTLKLCMEDTFTDCPLYEQTLWVGDARNEALFAYDLYGATDISLRCIKLAAQSLERFPIVGCQVPSAWDCLLPAWSFLWGISVWDYYDYTGDRRFLQDIFPAVIANLRGAEQRLDAHGLFSGPFWNMFDWSGIDDGHETVLHNSLLLAGALRAAIACAQALGEKEAQRWLKDFLRRLARSINRAWDVERRAYPDSIHQDGSPSPHSSQHTSFLGLLYEVIPPEHQDAALANLLAPPEGMTQVGSPFAMLYFYEALEKVAAAGRPELLDLILQSIYQCYLPMLAAGAATVWETFPTSSVRPGEFPTRSHCHAWSAAPLRYLPRILLGIRPAALGGASFQVSPRLNGLSWAKGAVATLHGALAVEWRLEGSRLFVHIQAPPNVQVEFVPNETHRDLEIIPTFS